MKVITKIVSIEDKKFVLIQTTREDFKEKVNDEIIGQFGTIDYDWLDANGRLIRPISLIEMSIATTISQAIENRVDAIKTKGLSIEDMAEYYKNKYLKRVA